MLFADWRNVKFGLLDSFTFVFLFHGIMYNLSPTFLSLGEIDRYYIRDVLGIASIPGIFRLLGIGLFTIGFREFPIYEIIWPLLILVFLFLEVWRIRLMELGFTELSKKDHLLGITTMFWFVSFVLAFSGTLFFIQIWFYDIQFDHIVLICLVLGYVWISGPIGLIALPISLYIAGIIYSNFRTVGFTTSFIVSLIIVFVLLKGGYRYFTRRKLSTSDI